MTTATALTGGSVAQSPGWVRAHSRAARLGFSNEMKKNSLDAIGSRSVGDSAALRHAARQRAQDGRGGAGTAPGCVERVTRSSTCPCGLCERRKRSEERRVGKECRSRWTTDHEKKN